MFYSIYVCMLYAVQRKREGERYIAWTWGSPLKRANMRFKINCQKKTDFTPSDFTDVVLWLRMWACLSFINFPTLSAYAAHAAYTQFALWQLTARWAYA